MRLLIKSLFLLSLLACAACTRASMIEPRRDHILAGPHGWIDVTLHAPSAASPASAPAGGVPGCIVAIDVNGEAALRDDADLARADAAQNPLGYRFVAPVGTLEVALTISRCVTEPVRQSLAMPLAQDHLSVIEFDGRRLALKSNEPFTPASLDALRMQSSALHSDVESVDVTLSSLTRLVHLSVLLNGVVLAILAVAAIAVAIRHKRASA